MSIFLCPCRSPCPCRSTVHGSYIYIHEHEHLHLHVHISVHVYVRASVPVHSYCLNINMTRTWTWTWTLELRKKMYSCNQASDTSKSRELHRIQPNTVKKNVFRESKQPLTWTTVINELRGSACTWTHFWKAHSLLKQMLKIYVSFFEKSGATLHQAV